MNKLEISEIKKQYGIKTCNVSRIAGCYVNGEKEIKATFNKNFLSLPEEEIFKYLEIFKKGLTGSKNISTSEFSTQAEEKGSMHEFLLRLRDSELKNDDMLKIFYEKVIECYQNESTNYLILLIYNVYDVPYKGSDNRKSSDAGDEVYAYITFYICPVKLEDGGLYYNPDKCDFEQKDRRWCVDMPVYSFLFPSFEDRMADIHHLTIYTKKTDGKFDDFTSDLCGISPCIAPDIQKTTFQSALSEAVQEDPDAMETVKAINETIVERIEAKETPDEINLEISEIKKIAKESGMSEKGCGILEDRLTKVIGDKPLKAENLVDKKTMQLKSPDVVIKVSNDLASQVRTQKLADGKYILVPIVSESTVEVNGISLG